MGGLDLEHAVSDLEERDVERAAAEVEYEDRLIGILVEPVGERRRGRLVDDAEHGEPGDLAGLLRGLPLGVVEVRRDRDDGLVDLVAEVALRVSLQLREDLRGDLLGGPLLPVDVDRPVPLAHVALDGADGAVGVRDRLSLGDLADEDLRVLGERHDRRGQPGPFGVRDDDRFAGLQGRDDGVRGSKVDPYCSWHLRVLLDDEPIRCLSLSLRSG